MLALIKDQGSEMKVEIINRSGHRIISCPFITKWVYQIFRELRKRRIPFSNGPLNLVFVNSFEMQQLNKKFRFKDKPTDVLSFSFTSPFKGKQQDMGDVVLCAQYIKKMKQGPVRERTAYAILHGILHLLGFEHEKNPKEAKKMYNIQDQIFEKYFQ